jgi:NADH:ubiquinone oxidoreductase subunit 4 (subunit M)
MLLTYIFSILLFSIFILFLVPKTNIFLLRVVALVSSSVVFFLCCILLINFNCNFYYFQNVTTFSLNFELLNLYLSFGIDGLSLWFFIFK